MNQRNLRAAMKKLSLFLIVAVIAAVAISLTWQPMSFEERAIQLQLDQSSPELGAALKDEPLGVKAVFVDYADDKMLLLKAQAALMKYPQMAREIFPLYGDAPGFREILLAYGESVLPPIDYFLNNDVYSVNFAHYAGRKMRAAKRSARRLMAGDQRTANRDTATPSADANADAANTLTAEQRGWYAVKYIQNEGHNFLGQFVVDGQGKPKWIQSERVMEDASALLTSGIRGLETKVQTRQPVTAGDVGWAAVDTLVVVSAVKLLRIGEAAAASGESLNASTRTAALASRLARGSRLGSRIVQYGKWPAIAVAAYMAVRHPSIMSDAFGGLAHFVGLPAWVGVFAGWTLLLLPVLYLATWFMRVFARPIAAVLRTLLRLLPDGRRSAFPFLPYRNPATRHRT